MINKILSIFIYTPRQSFESKKANRLIKQRFFLTIRYNCKSHIQTFFIVKDIIWIEEALLGRLHDVFLWVIDPYIDLLKCIGSDNDRNDHGDKRPD